MATFNSTCANPKRWLCHRTPYGIRVLSAATLLAAALTAFAQDGSALLARAEQRVDAIDSLNHLFSGNFRQVVVSHSHFGDDKLSNIDTFAVKVINGIQDSRESIAEKPAKAGVRMPPNSASVFALRNALFPFRASGDPEKVRLSVRRLADTTIVNKPCAVLDYDYDLQSDSTVAHGAGKLWITLDEATPLISAYKLGVHHPRRGDVLSGVIVRTMPFGPGAVIVRNETDARFALHGKTIGNEDATVVNSNFLPR